MSEYCRYTMEVTGALVPQCALPVKLGDLLFEFRIDNEKLAEMRVTFPVPPGRLEDSERSGAGCGDELRVYEPRASEIEEVVLQIAAGLSIFTRSKIEIPFHSSKIEWVDEFLPGALPVGPVVRRAGRTDEDAVRNLSTQHLHHSLVTASVFGQHDPSLTFYFRGSADLAELRHIEAFYNLYFFIEYRFGDGKFHESAVVAAFTGSRELCETTKRVIDKREFALIVSPAYIETISSMSLEEYFRHLFKVRGKLHHANMKHPQKWHPDKQNRFANEALVLYFICMELAITSYLERAMHPSVLNALDSLKQTSLSQGREPKGSGAPDAPT